MITLCMFAFARKVTWNSVKRYNVDKPLLLRTNRLFSNWPVNKVRATFIDYFKDTKGHTFYPSSPVIPVHDETLLFANAGMNQFKPIFMGAVEAGSSLANLNRAVNSQKCIRAGGKHNDLDDVGKDTYHHTFFEMLGTWSFGNYFKKEAIPWAYDILVNTYGLSPDRLYASYFAGDETLGIPCDTEARDLWLQFLPPDRVLPFDKKSNFWEMGDTGPCGPCTEIHYDRVGNRDASKLVNADVPDVLEIWNIVFIQYNREVNGELVPLPEKHVDTGMGLERLTSILQNKSSNYDTEVFSSYFDVIHNKVGGLPYLGKVGAVEDKDHRDTAYRVLADHIRTLCIAIADGAVPSNEGRGYVLRRILRRALRYGTQVLQSQSDIMSSMVPLVVTQLGHVFPSLLEHQEYIQKVLLEEEKSFESMLKAGSLYLCDVMESIEKANQPKSISGKVAFFLYDSLGFPIDLTQIIAAEKGYTVNVEEFHILMNEQKEKSRHAAVLKRTKGRSALGLGPSHISLLKEKSVLPTNDSMKYDNFITISRGVVKGFLVGNSLVDRVTLPLRGGGNEVHGQEEDGLVVGVILDETPFYSESGGQIGDVGTITMCTSADAGRGGDGEHSTDIVLQVLDVQMYGSYVLHTCLIPKNLSSSHISLESNIPCVSQVDKTFRQSIVPNHSITHVVNLALRSCLADDTVDQRGSLVTDEKLRFDFKYNKPLSAKQQEDVEIFVNDLIQKDVPVQVCTMPLEDALKIHGIRALFGEVYPENVRVVNIGSNSLLEMRSDPTNLKWKEQSVEFCGGQHVSSLGDAKCFVLVEETGVSKGTRRIVGITGERAIHAKKLGDSIFDRLNDITTSINIQLYGHQVHHNTTYLSEDVILDLKQQLSDFRSELNASVISSAVKLKCRDMIESSTKSVHQYHLDLKHSISENVGVAMLRDIDQWTLESNKTTMVFRFSVPFGVEVSKITKKLTDRVRENNPHISYVLLLVVHGDTADEQSKVICLTHVSESGIQAGLNANSWMQSILARFGGRGGGRDTLAQGTITSVQVGQIEAIDEYSKVIIDSSTCTE